MPINFQNIINYSIKLGYAVPGQNGIPSTNFANTQKLPNCYFGEYDATTQSFVSSTPTTINRVIQVNPAIVILAESPHKNEYTYNGGIITPRFPLSQHHSRIKKQLNKYVPPGLNGKYDVYLVNAIPYQCSFGLNLKQYGKQKNNVFALTWNMEDALTDLISEITPLIKNDRLIILNCCTKELRKHLCMTDILKTKFSNTSILEAPHPSKWK